MNDDNPVEPEDAPTIRYDSPGTHAETGKGTPRTVPEGGEGRVAPERSLGPYEIIDEIGRGGMGVVFKAFHPDLKRTVALKAMIAGEDASEDSITRFRREAEAVAKLGHHPNIVPVYDIGCDGARHYIAMHYVEGSSLDGMIEGEEVGPRLAAEIAKKVAEGLQHAHRSGVLHRDIKPANILLTRDGQPMITDFGLAKDVESHSAVTRSGVALGTPQYMPPEQADGRVKDIDARSDVYSLGATLYEMLSMRPPFEGSTVVNVIKKVILEDAVPLRRGNPHLDRALETICMKCLEKDPSRRYQTAQELADDLGRYLAREPIHARPPSAWEKFLRRVRRHKIAYAGVGVAILALAAGAVVAWMGVLGGERRSAEADRRATDAETLKKEAEAEKRAAERREKKAEALLEKGRRVSRVMLGAHTKLGRIHDALKQAYYDSTFVEKDRQDLYDRYSERIDEFIRSVPDDSASQAAALAVKGWFLFLGEYEPLAGSHYRQARKTDPQIAWGYLFESLAYLSIYLSRMNVPSSRVGSEGLTFDERVVENEEMRKAREAFEALGLEMQNATVWGEEAAQQIGEVMETFGSVREGDMEKLGRGLTMGLALPELAWLEEEFRFARAKVFYSLRRFDESVKDIDLLLEVCPKYLDAHYIRGIIVSGLAGDQAARGADAVKIYEEAIRDFSRALELDERMYFSHNGIAMCLAGIGREQARMGLNPVQTYEKAIEEYNLELENNPEDSRIYNNRGAAHLSLAEWAMRMNRDPRKHSENARADFDRAIAMDYQYPEAYSGRGLTRTMTAMWLQTNTEEDVVPLLREAVADFDRVLETAPGDREGLHNRATAFVKIAEAEWDKDLDPLPSYEKAIADYDAILEKWPRSVTALDGRATVHRHLADLDDEKGRDPRGNLEKAVEGYRMAIAIRPNYTFAMNNLGVTYFSMGMNRALHGENPDPLFEKSLETFDRGIDINPNFWQAMHNRGRTLFRMLRVEEALESFEKASAVVGKDPPALDRNLKEARGVAKLGPWMRKLYIAQIFLKAGAYVRTGEIFRKVLDEADTLGPKESEQHVYYTAVAHYNLACLHSLLSAGKTSPKVEAGPVNAEEKETNLVKALSHLEEAITRGYGLQECETDADLAPLRDDPRFKVLVKELKER